MCFIGVGWAQHVRHQENCVGSFGAPPPGRIWRCRGRDIEEGEGPARGEGIANVGGTLSSETQLYLLEPGWCRDRGCRAKNGQWGT